MNVVVKLDSISLHSEPQAMCYTETSNLDGETNLKIRQVRRVRNDPNAVLYRPPEEELVMGLCVCTCSNRVCVCISGSPSHSWSPVSGGADGSLWPSGV